MRRLQNQVRHGAGDFLAAGVRPADLNVAGLGEVEARDMEHGLFVSQGARGCVALIVRLEQHVQATQRAAAVIHARQHLIPGDPLAGFAEGARLLGYQPFVDRGHLFQVLAQLGVRLLAGHLARFLGCPPDPILHAQYDCFQPGVEIVLALLLFRVCLSRNHQAAVVANLIQQAAPAQVQADLQILTEVLAAEDRRAAFVLVILLHEVREGESCRCESFAIGEEVRHIPAGQRTERVDVNGVRFQQATIIFTARARPEETAIGVVAHDLHPVQHDVGHLHARSAHGFHDLSSFGRRQNNGPVVEVHRALQLLLFARVLQFRRA